MLKQLESFLTSTLSALFFSDLPSVLSGEKLGMIDPHQLFFPNSSHGWNIAKNQDLLKTLRHQVDPYLGLFDCDENTFKNGYYKGTLFRFPLRCAPSPLSKEPYSQDKVYALFDSFRREAHFLPIFLRNLEKIEIYERDKFSPTPKLLFRLEITEDCLEEIRKKRTDFLKRTRSSDWLDKPIVTTYLMKLRDDRVSTEWLHGKTTGKIRPPVSHHKLLLWGATISSI